MIYGKPLTKNKVSHIKGPLSWSNNMYSYQTRTNDDLSQGVYIHVGVYIHGIDKMISGQLSVDQ